MRLSRPILAFVPTRASGGLAALAGAAFLAAACGGPASGPGSRPATPVEAITLSLHPVELSTEFLGVVKSRRSATVKPQVEGFITKILVSSGDRVSAGAPLVQIDSGKQQATVASLESQRLARQADLQYAQQQAARAGKLEAAGAISRSELERVEAQLATTQAQLEAIEAQIREQRVDLGYHLVSAPTSGVIGDVPVRVGDSVTRSTMLTTIDQSAGLELYINVPVREAPRLKPGLPVRLIGEDGALLATETLSFVAPSVDPATQSVLTKASLEQATDLRTEQFVRARIVWSEEPGLTIPVVSLSRINGQYFAYLVEDGEAGTTVARQRVVEPGIVVGNDYLVKSGLKPGDELIVSGVQKIRDGAPVSASAPAPPAADASPVVATGE